MNTYPLPSHRFQLSSNSQPDSLFFCPFSATPDEPPTPLVRLAIAPRHGSLPRSLLFCSVSRFTWSFLSPPGCQSVTQTCASPHFFFIIALPPACIATISFTFISCPSCKLVALAFFASHHLLPNTFCTQQIQRLIALVLLS